MDLNLRGKKALVTGASRGIGRAIAVSLAKEGAHVALVARNESSLRETVSELGGAKMGHMGFACDLESESGPAELVTDLGKKFGDIDIVVQNLGGTMDVSDPFCSLSDWKKVFRSNLEVAIELNLALLPHMRSQKWGRIVHIGSIASVENNGPVTYCAAKAALAAYSRSLGRVLAAEGVVVTTVFPGVILTEGGYWDVAGKERPEHVAKYLKERCPSGRFGLPEEVAHIAAFLCSDAASFFQGSIIPVDGGNCRGYFT